MKPQIELIKEITELKEQHPNYDIHFLVDSDTIEDDFSWYPSLISSVKLGVWLETEWGVQTSISDIEEYFNETDEKYAEFDDSIKPELEALKQKAKASILIYMS